MKQLGKLLPISAILLLLAGCGEANLTALDPQGPVAEMQLSLIKLSLYVMIFVIVVVFAIFAFVLWRYREKPGDTHIPMHVEGSKTLEIIWTTVPVLLLLIIAVPNVMDTFTLANVDADDGEETVTVRVTAHQFWWEFEYLDYDIVAGQDMYIPTNTKIIVELEASDVMHSFWVPALAGKQDNVPGITNEMWLKADHPGVYKGKCTELCGQGHWLMDFKVIAVEPDKFENWATNMAKPEREPATQLAEAGREVFQQSCIACHAVSGVGGNPAIGGPDLTNFGERTVIAGFLEFNDENLEKWLRYPQETKAGNTMPAFNHLDENDMAALIEYMKGLKVLD